MRLASFTRLLFVTYLATASQVCHFLLTTFCVRGR